MCRLCHPNVLRLHEMLTTRSKMYLVMELSHGGDLFSKLASLPTRRLSKHAARRVFLQLVSALIYCHVCSVSHRDVKPQNMLLDTDDNLKVYDFGLTALPHSLHDDGLLHTAYGIPAFVAPEILRRRPTTEPRPTRGPMEPSPSREGSGQRGGSGRRDSGQGLALDGGGSWFLPHNTKQATSSSSLSLSLSLDVQNL
ncbi:hypothetical protein GUJ93_ZPchr0001g32244 [Zizania palustris]|uniref:Protein kinase domain-containing protein n=1 Tax=Zizania palustris TaxID=103762 RepID=A0A8J5RP26_ZIZPA|nr:hypothetical protein GUJ93_ZPchr0001g32244 [Zizania palustris]